jgi:hypothetical protein
VLEVPGRPASADCSAPDAIALAANGEIGVIRFPSARRPPTSDDPALLLRARNAHVPLAPWSALRSSDSAECSAPANDEVRVLIVGSASFIGLRLGGASTAPAELGMLAQVRWSASRLCLEAIELSGAPEVEVGEGALTTAVVARFGANREAGRRGLDFGVEYSEPLACRIEQPNPR